MHELESRQWDNPGPFNNPYGTLTQMPFWRTARRRHWRLFKTLTVRDTTTEKDTDGD